MVHRGGLFSKVVAGLAGTVLTMLMASTSASAQTKRYLVTFKSKTTFEAMNRQFERLNRGAGSARPMVQGLRFFSTEAAVTNSLKNLGMVVIESAQPVDVESIRRHPAIADIEEEVFFKGPTPIATFAPAAPAIAQDEQASAISTPWGILAVKAPEAWDAAGKGEGQRVLVLDTGIDKNHPAIQSRFEEGKDFTGRDGDSNAPYDYFDDIGHGTHVAGTILADGQNDGLVGVAPEAKLLAGRVCGEFGCSSVAIVEGIDWGIEQKVDVISMSLGGPFPSRAGRQACERAEAANIVVVAASGNDGVGRVSYPAAYETVVAVGAINSSLVKAEFSQWGPQLDVVAPGVDVISAVPVGSGRESQVRVDLGDGELVTVKSKGFQGAPEMEEALISELVFAGLGKTSDFAKANVRGKFALIQRGEIRFSEKVENAIRAGASGVVIFNNAPGLINGALTEDGSQVAVPVVMIEQTVGENLRQALDQGKTGRASIATVRTDYAAFEGTSMATPHVSGVVALVRAANPDLTAAQVREVLKSTATALGPNDENQYGSGVVNAEAAVAKALAFTQEMLLTGTGL